MDKSIGWLVNVDGRLFGEMSSSNWVRISHSCAYPESKHVVRRDTRVYICVFRGKSYLLQSMLAIK